MDISNSANATFGGDINADALSVNAGAQLTVNKATLNLSGALALKHSATAGATLALGDKTLAVTGAVTLSAATSTHPHKLSLAINASGTPGRLDARAGGLTLGASPEIEVNIAEGVITGTRRTFIIARSNAASALPASLESAPLSGSCASHYTCTLTRVARQVGGTSTANLDLQLTVAPLPPQIIDRDTPVMPVMVPLNANGAGSGVEFRVDRTLGVANDQSIGRREVAGTQVSVATNGGATPRASIHFAGSGTVTGRIGGELSNATDTSAGTAFTVSPSNLLKTLQLNGPAASTVTFNGGIGAETLNFAGDSTAALKGPATGSGDIFYRLNVTASSGGQGTLRFGNRNPANLLGDIGIDASGRINKLALVSVEAPPDSAGGRTVRILGDIYAQGIAINGASVLALGNLTIDVFGAGRSRPYVIDAPITGTANVATLHLQDYAFDVRGPIGTSAARLNSVNVTASRDTRFGAAIHAAAVSLQNSQVTVTRDLEIAGSGGVFISEGQEFTVVSSGADLPATLEGVTVNGNSARWDFDLSLSANGRDLVLRAQRARPGFGAILRPSRLSRLQPPGRGPQALITHKNRPRRRPVFLWTLGLCVPDPVTVSRLANSAQTGFLWRLGLCVPDPVTVSRLANSAQTGFLWRLGLCVPDPVTVSRLARRRFFVAARSRARRR